METVGLVGLGKMGLGIAENLLKAGFLKAVYKRTIDDEIKQLEKKGVYIAKSPEDLAGKVDYVLLSIPNEAVEDVVFGKNGLVGGLNSTKIVVDTGNCDPRQSMRIAEKLKQKGIFFLDAGVSGGPGRADKGTLAVWVGGDKEAYDRVMKVLNAIGKPQYLGPSGNGHKVKMLHNLLEQEEMQAIAEVANLAVSLNLDPKKVFKTIRDGLVQSHLGDLYTNIPDGEITSREPKVGGGDYPRMALEISKDAPLPEGAVSYWMRIISRASKEDREKIIEEAVSAIGAELRKLKDDEEFEYGFQTLSALRKAFGGHK
ncbi:MAG: NAD(P)-binding domain-containing protein [Candidatus Aenigmarchaeota archaeon]|nr:NAD(P)-binding domain-containing protein [Candidatus Aenigmarchaeota archaeon]